MVISMKVKIKVNESKKLYISKNAERDKKKIIKSVQKRKKRDNVFIISLSEDENDLLDIYPSYIFVHPNFNRTEISIVGISKGYNEAVELVKLMAEDCYSETGGMELKSYFKF